MWFTLIIHNNNNYAEWNNSEQNIMYSTVYFAYISGKCKPI